MSKRPGVFISYAQPDGVDFVRRLAFALGMYMDVYWDRRLQTGDFPADLRQHINSCDHFLWLLTPYALASDWNRRAFEAAKAQGKPILLAKAYASDAALESAYPTADFTTDFEAGFRTLASAITGQPYASWESLSSAPINVLLNYLKAGIIPAVITRQIGEWVLVDKLWDALTSELGGKKSAKIVFSKPRTAGGVLTQAKLLLEQFEKAKDTRHSNLVKPFIPVIETCVNDLMTTADDQHLRAGQIAHDIIAQLKGLIEAKQTADRDFEKLHLTKTFYDFDIAEQLRVLINDHARRSRPLY
ncbi:MAG: toll/interleukin-1 receptor domain-containing protein [Chloroflexi bacterium]|nr:toll/interleukin-1 receptor domain-containing protein [Chloroflexota bacterium]MCC6896034.1 toll/interleukin-1 receptor domain-containing protein [Anaerolineae bacterium]